MKSFLLAVSIDGIDLCANGIKIHFYHYLVFYIDQKKFNVLNSTLYRKK